MSLEDFEFGPTLGSGSFGQVFKVKFKLNSKSYALKKLDKEFINKNKKQKNLLREKKILMSLDHPSIIKLYQTFQVIIIIDCYLGLISINLYLCLGSEICLFHVRIC